jgi:EAL domain-containing protein (putative c-di-GMP-specific phosphodiesterase class I)
VLADADRCVSVLEGLRRLGVGLSLDDFGTGHASLSRLATLPIDELKIDRSFITDVAHDAAHRAIARTIVDLGLRVAAEGIEDDECLATVRALGCDVAQGYGLERPMLASAIAERLGAVAGVTSRRSAPPDAGSRAWRRAARTRGRRPPAPSRSRPSPAAAPGA